MKRILIVAVGIVVLGGTALVLLSHPDRLEQVYRSVPRQQAADDALLDGVRWRSAALWDFRNGPFPAAWSWGTWCLVDGVLEGSSEDGEFAVYVCPCEHGGDFLLETRLRIVGDAGGQPAEAHLLTRDSRDLHSESGMVLFGGRRHVSVRHMVGGKEHVLRVVKPEQPVSEGAWHLLRFAVRGGRVEARLDGTVLFASDQTYPVSVYREPHLAVRNGKVQFSSFKVYVAP